jgi:hypothetical protein
MTSRTSRLEAVNTRGWFSKIMSITVDCGSCQWFTVWLKLSSEAGYHLVEIPKHHSGLQRSSGGSTERLRPTPQQPPPPRTTGTPNREKTCKFELIDLGSVFYLFNMFYTLLTKVIYDTVHTVNKRKKQNLLPRPKSSSQMHKLHKHVIKSISPCSSKSSGRMKWAEVGARAGALPGRRCPHTQYIKILFNIVANWQ